MEISIRTITHTFGEKLNTGNSKTIHRHFSRKLKKSRKRLIRYSLLTVNFALLLAVVTFVVKSPSSSQAVKQNSIASASSAVAANPLDELSSADIAAHVAQVANLAELPSVRNTADTYKAELSITAEDRVLAKPQVIGTPLPSYKDIRRYKTVEGDTIGSLATKFGVTSDSIRWSNSLNGDSIAVGRDLVIPPVNGIVYKVKDGDTVEKLAEKYRASKEEIILTNDTEIRGLVLGTEIVIPNAVQPVSTFGGYAYNFGRILPVYGANGYDYGWCTWHAANRRREIGNPIPSNLGNAISWYSIARNAGLPTGTEPRAGAVLWHANMGGLGHVAFVEKDNGDGTFLVSDMNYPIWGRVTYRTITPAEFGNFRFIY
jgi:N-acetylmuramoyl-L-alanine amidase